MKSIVPIPCMMYSKTEDSVNVHYWHCCQNTKEDAENICGDILEKYVMYGFHLPRGLKWSLCVALVTYCV